MKIPNPNRCFGYLLTEALVYISVVVVLLGIGYAAMYKCIDNSIALRRSAADISTALQAGERWRADVRAATSIQTEPLEGIPTLRLNGTNQVVAYQLNQNTLSRRIGPGPWVPVLINVQTSMMQSDPRPGLTAWRWELELKPRSKHPRVRPLFTFFAVPQSKAP